MLGTQLKNPTAFKDRVFVFFGDGDASTMPIAWVVALAPDFFSPRIHDQCFQDCAELRIPSLINSAKDVAPSFSRICARCTSTVL